MKSKKYVEDFMKFVDKTGSPYHSVKASVEKLKKAGFQRLDLSEGAIRLGGKFFITRNQTEIFAFVVGSNFDIKKSSFVIVGSHTDSPCLKLKPNFMENREGFEMLNVSTYGGGLWHTWLDRPLTLAGKIVVKMPKTDRLKEFLVNLEKPVAYIPNLAIHLQTGAEREALKLNPQDHLGPIVALGGKNFDLKKLLMENAGVGVGVGAELLDVDLCLREWGPSVLCGAEDEFVSSPRIDNVLSLWASVTALCEASESLAKMGEIFICCSFDNEEVGSQTPSGADSGTFVNFLRMILENLSGSGGGEATGNGPYGSVTESDFLNVIEKSFVISADCAHATHPNYAGKHENKHKIALNKGIVIKTNTNMRYASSCMSISILREIAQIGGVPVQDFVVKNDSPCGSTIGPMISCNSGIETVDVGAPQLAMHSAREMCGAEDVFNLYSLCENFYLNYKKVRDNYEKV